MKVETQVKIMILVVIIEILLLCRAINVCSWNNGYCQCGGKWVYQKAVEHAYHTSHVTSYIYQCDKCRKAEEFFNK